MQIKKEQVDSDTQEKNSFHTVVALDYSTHRIQYSIWHDGDLFQYGEYFPEGDSPYSRFPDIYDWLTRVISEVRERRGDFLIALQDSHLSLMSARSKKVYSNTSPAVYAFKTKSQLMGVLIYACEKNSIPYIVYSKREWKDILGIESRGSDAQLDEQIILMDNEGIKANENNVDAICLGYVAAKENSSS